MSISENTVWVFRDIAPHGCLMEVPFLHLLGEENKNNWEEQFCFLQIGSWKNKVNIPNANER